MAWCWDGGARAGWSSSTSATRLPPETSAPWDDLRGTSCRLVDDTNDVAYRARDGATLCDGLYVELGPWAWHLFRVEPVSDAR